MNFKRFAAAVSAFAVILLGLLLLAGCAPRGEDQGGDALARIQAKGEITVALEGTWSPWGYHDQSGELVGYDVEVARAIAEKLGVKAAFVEGEFNGLLAGLEAGRYDIMVNVVKNENEDIKSMEDLEGKLTANTLQSTYAAVGERYGAQVTGVDDFIQTIELLTDRRIDATLNADVSFSDYMAQHPDAPIKIACTDPDASQVAIPMPKGADSDALRAAIDKALGELAADGTLTGLSLKYFGLDISKGG